MSSFDPDRKTFVGGYRLIIAHARQCAFFLCTFSLSAVHPFKYGGGEIARRPASLPPETSGRILHVGSALSTERSARSSDAVTF